MAKFFSLKKVKDRDQLDQLDQLWINGAVSGESRCSGGRGRRRWCGTAW